jgi:predicted transcriptional regulator
MTSVPKKPIMSYMSSPMKILSTESKIHDAISLFIHEHIHGAPVMQGDNVLCGIVSMSDILWAVLKGNDLQTPVTSIMTREIFTIDALTRLDEAITLFKEKQVGRFIVMKNKIPVGIITRSDIVRALQTLQV